MLGGSRPGNAVPRLAPVAVPCSSRPLSRARIPVAPIENPAVPSLAPREVPEFHATAFTDAELHAVPRRRCRPGREEALRWRPLYARRCPRCRAAAFRRHPLLERPVPGLLHLDRNAEAGALFAALANDSPRAREPAPISTRPSPSRKLISSTTRSAEYEAVSPEQSVWGEAQLGLARVLREKLSTRSVRWARSRRSRTGPGRAPAATPAGRGAGLHRPARERLGRPRHRQALADLELWSEHPLAKISDAALADAKRLGLKADPSNAESCARAEVLLDANRNEAALALLKPLLTTWKLPEPAACQTHFLYGKGLRKQRQHGARCARAARHRAVHSRCEPACAGAVHRGVVGLDRRAGVGHHRVHHAGARLPGSLLRRRCALLRRRHPAEAGRSRGPPRRSAHPRWSTRRPTAKATSARRGSSGSSGSRRRRASPSAAWPHPGARRLNRVRRRPRPATWSARSTGARARSLSSAATTRGR